jgi:hypothetical protein
MNLVSYSSSDSDDDEQKSVNIQSENERTRLFPHETGNWALSIYTFGMI